MVIEHPQSALNSQIVVTKHIGPLHTEQQDHLRCPDANTLQTAQFADHLPVRFLPYAVQIKRTVPGLLRQICDVFRLTEGHTQGLQFRDSRRKDALRVHLTQRIPHPLPDGRLRLSRYLLADDMMDNGREQVRIHGTVDIPNTVNDFTKPPVFLPQIGNLCFPVFEIHHCHRPFIFTYRQAPPLNTVRL